MGSAFWDKIIQFEVWEMIPEIKCITQSPNQAFIDDNHGQLYFLQVRYHKIKLVYELQIIQPFSILDESVNYY